MAYQVIDDFLPEDQALAIRQTMLGPDFPWYFSDNVTSEEYDEEHSSLLNYQLTHVFYYNFSWNSPQAQLILPLVDKIQPKALIRIKANLNPVTAEPYAGGWHQDFKFPCKTGVYYVNDNNGYTEFENGEKVESKANRFVEFDSEHLHTGVTATNVKARCLINFNWIQ